MKEIEVGLGRTAMVNSSPRPSGPARISGLALSHPSRSFSQQDVLDLLGLAEDDFAVRIFSRSGVTRRRLDLLPDLGQTPMQGRTDAVEAMLLEYAVDAVEQLEIDPSEIGTVITSSLYSLGCPTLDHRLVARFRMSAVTDKYHVVGVGCASAVPLIRLAEQSLRAQPGRKALIVASESMSGFLSQATDEDERSKTVGSSIFGDGCGAMLIDLDSGDGSGPSVVASRVHHVTNTLDAVTMRFSPADSYLHMVRELPDVAGANLRPLVDDFLEDNGITSHLIDHWVLHPGGRRIIEAAQRALSLSDDDVRASFDVLANHGNVGTPTIFYVLHETIAQRQPSPGDHGVVVTIGPGVTVGLMLLRW